VRRKLHPPSSAWLSRKRDAVTNVRETSSWGADFFGGLNELPPEPVSGISGILEAMATLPAYQEARRWMLRELKLAPGSSIAEGGCGTGAALADLLEFIGPNGRVAGVDPTTAFVEQARERARTAGAANATYEAGDFRATGFSDGAFDAAFCDKVLIHAGPPSAALAEMQRIVRPGGGIGACEWLPFFALSSRLPEALDAFNAVFRKSVYDYGAAANLAYNFGAAGLADVRTRTFLATTNGLDEHPFWRAFIVHQMPLFIHAGLIDEPTAGAFVADIEDLDGQGAFSASFIVRAAVGSKMA
jgi:ubiquinone/menaquinone biosynthesis C-methylase UbiE